MFWKYWIRVKKIIELTLITLIKLETNDRINKNNNNHLRRNKIKNEMLIICKNINYIRIM